MKSKKVAISQSNYIPWRGYFSMINYVDEFVIYDEMQYTKNDWRNRNKIKTPSGNLWITIPIIMSGHFGQKINETKVLNNLWRKKHWKTLKQYYSKADYFKDYEQMFEELFLENKNEYLSDINISFINLINKILGITTIISKSCDYDLVGNKSEKLVNLCKSLNTKEYVSGPSAKSYLDINLFNRENIGVHWMNYDNLIEYKQLFGPFENFVSILDLIFNEGPNSFKYLKSL